MQKRLRLNGSPHPPWEGAILRGKGMSRHAGLHSDMNFVKTAEPIEMPFGLRTWEVPRNHVLDGGPDHPMGSCNFGGNGSPV